MAPTTQRRRRLTRDEILLAAVRIVDQSGIDALTMRALAVEIESDPTAVYRHFRDKQELLMAVVDQVLQDLRYPEVGTSWRPLAFELAVSLRDILRSHPGITLLLASGPPTAGIVAATVRTQALLQAAGMTIETAVRAHRTVISYVVGWVLIEQGAGSGTQPAHFSAAQQLARAQGANPTPVADAVAADRSTPGEFEFGLDLILDGLTAHISNKAG